MNSKGQWVVMCRNPAHTNRAIQRTEKQAIEHWNEWCFVVQSRRGKQNPKDHFWFLRLRADVLKCCGNPDNLDVVQFPNQSIKATCNKCNRVHRTMIAEQGTIGSSLQ